MAHVFASVLRLFLRDRWTRATVVSASLLVGLAAALVLRALPRTETVALHYNTSFGIDLVGPWWHALALPTAGAYLIVLNLGISAAVWRRDRTLSYFLNVGTVAVGLAVAVAAALVVYLNT